MYLQFSIADSNVAMQSEGRGELRCGDFSGSFLTLLYSKFLKHTDQTIYSVIFFFFFPGMFHTPLPKA